MNENLYNQLEWVEMAGVSQWFESIPYFQKCCPSLGLQRAAQSSKES